MRIQLSDHFTYRRLLVYTLPSIVMMIFTSIYNIVDGLFVSNFVGKGPFAAVNIVYPVFMVIGSVGFMLGAGGSAIVARTLGEGDKPRAHRYFSMLIYMTLILGIAATALFEIFLHPVCVLLGAKGELLTYCLRYARVCTLTMPCFMLQTSFQMYFNVAEKPRLGLAVTMISGVTNIILDALLVGALGMGLVGAALATNISEIVGGLTPILYFSHKNSSLLRLTRARFLPRIFLEACGNGSSEMLSNIASSIVSILYNHQLLRLAGADGVAAYGAVMYVSFIFAAIQIGYANGSAPIVSFHYGAAHKSELRNLFRKSLAIEAGFGAAMTVLAELFAPVVTAIFVGYDAGLFAMTLHGFRLFSIGFLLTGFNIYGSSFFTALSNGVVSAVISFLRTLVFEVIVILVLPRILGLDGIWLGSVFAEVLALIVTTLFLVKLQKRYGY